MNADFTDEQLLMIKYLVERVSTEERCFSVEDENILKSICDKLDCDYDEGCNIKDGVWR